MRYQELENNLREGDERQKKNNITISGLQEKRHENYFESMDMVVNRVSESMKA
jgi:hypothetical protein